MAAERRSQTPAGIEMVKDIPIQTSESGEVSKFARLSFPDDLSAQECGYFSSQLRSLARGFREIAGQRDE